MKKTLVFEKKSYEDDLEHVSIDDKITIILEGTGRTIKQTQDILERAMQKRRFYLVRTIHHVERK